MVLFWSAVSWRDLIGPFRPFSYRVLPCDVKCWRRPEKCAITAGKPSAAKEVKYGCSIL